MRERAGQRVCVNSDQGAAMGRLAQALESVYRDRYGPVAARYIVECIAEGKDYSDVLMPRGPMPDIATEIVTREILGEEPLA